MWFKFLDCCLIVLIFVVSNVFLFFLIRSLFLSCSRFFDISVNGSGLFLLYVETYV